MTDKKDIKETKEEAAKEAKETAKEVREHRGKDEPKHPSERDDVRKAHEPASKDELKAAREESPEDRRFPSQIPHTTKEEAEAKDMTRPENNPDMDPQVPSKRDQPLIPLSEEEINTAGLIANIHRGLNPKYDELSSAQKKDLREALDKESESERTFRDPSRELARTRAREQLGR